MPSIAAAAAKVAAILVAALALTVSVAATAPPQITNRATTAVTPTHAGGFTYRTTPPDRLSTPLPSPLTHPHYGQRALNALSDGLTYAIRSTVSNLLAVPIDTSNADDLATALRFQEFSVSIMSRPVFLGDQIPSSCHLPLSTEDLALIHGTADFYALDPYLYL
ncbi:hypothetical protein DFJ73DRAFT_781236 [Zopfochytrium polystomum]|nr:hypothetical protein DFJ73DRAFT_781236 [Zopfochytrium polystomum]